MRYSLLVIIFSTLLMGCTEAELTQDQLKSAVAIEQSDQCHLCGMIIENYPGPKGQIYQKDAIDSVKFCSVRDLLSYLLQPENIHNASQVFVHDMAKSPWESPDDDHFIDAKSAYYVVGSNKSAAMGPAIASFSELETAKQFKMDFGGEVIKFDDITMELLVNSHQMGTSAMSHDSMSHDSMNMTATDCDNMDHDAQHVEGMDHDTSMCKATDHSEHHSDSTGN